MKQGAPWELQTSLYPEGLVLVEIDKDGFLTDKTFWLRDGQLVPRDQFNAGNIKLSEAFAGPLAGNSRYRGIVGQSDIMFEEYREACQSFR